MFYGPCFGTVVLKKAFYTWCQFFRNFFNSWDFNEMEHFKQKDTPWIENQFEVVNFFIKNL